MSNLTILAWSGERQEVHFVGFNRSHTVAFVRDEQNRRRALVLNLPKLFNLEFSETPIGRNGSPPIEIKPAALHVPACFLDEAEMARFEDPKSNEVQSAKVFHLDLWKMLTRHKRCLERKHDKALSKLLRDELNRLRRRYAIREKEIVDEIARLPKGETNKPEELRKRLRDEFTTVVIGEFKQPKFINIFDTSLEMVRRGWGGLREKLLEKEWANEFAINLSKISDEATAFHEWLKACAHNTQTKTRNRNTGIVETVVGLNLCPWQLEVLESVVLYEVRFADGSRCWLDDISERAVTDPQELEDFIRLEEATEVATDERMTQAEVCHKLTVTRNGETKPMGKKGLQKLCESARVPFKFPMRGINLRKLEHHRLRQKRKRNERLKRNTEARKVR